MGRAKMDGTGADMIQVMVAFGGNAQCQQGIAVTESSPGDEGCERKGVSLLVTRLWGIHATAAGPLKQELTGEWIVRGFSVRTNEQAVSKQ